jgi:hypothetical protein
MQGASEGGWYKVANAEKRVQPNSQLGIWNCRKRGMSPEA